MTTKEPDWEAYDPQIAWEWHDWAEERIEELEAAHVEADKLFHQIADQRDELQRKYEALVEGIEIMLNVGACVNPVMENNIRALLEDYDD